MYRLTECSHVNKSKGGGDADAEASRIGYILMRALQTALAVSVLAHLSICLAGLLPPAYPSSIHMHAFSRPPQNGQHMPPEQWYKLCKEWCASVMRFSRVYPCLWGTGQAARGMLGRRRDCATACAEAHRLPPNSCHSCLYLPECTDGTLDTLSCK